MKIICISDSHGQHHSLNLPEGDLLLHAGDISMRGGRLEVESFVQWFSEQPHPVKIFIAGNHDFFFERESGQTIQEIIPENIIYLNDSGVTIGGYSIWGSPVTPWFYDWAFNRVRGADIQKHWEKIPLTTDILITHGPPFGILDRSANGELIGCKDILLYLEKINPKLHLFGHIHEGYGKSVKGRTTFINACVLNERYELKNAPIRIEL